MNELIWENVEKIAEESNCKKRHVGCLIVNGRGHFISAGYNLHDGECDCIPGPSTAMHAEVMAVMNIPEYAKSEKLYAYVNHQPCENCASLLDDTCEKVYINPTSKRLDGTKVLLSARGNTHGSFKEASRFVQAAKALMRSTPNWDNLKPYEQEGLDMICHKTGRLLYGDYTFADHVDDLAGYAELMKGKK